MPDIDLNRIICPGCGAELTPDEAADGECPRCPPSQGLGAWEMTDGPIPTLREWLSDHGPRARDVDVGAFLRAILGGDR